MSAIMSQKGRKMAKMLHNAAKKFDWVATNYALTVECESKVYFGHFVYFFATTTN